MLFATACQSNQQQPAAPGAFLGGTQGIVANFETFGVEENGVYTIFDTETFPLEVTLQNKGEYNLQPADVTITLLGPSPSEFTGIADYELQNIGIIETTSDLVPTGGEETISFASDAKYNARVTGVADRKWFANIEYKYQTYAIVSEVCLKEDLTDTRVCDVKGAKVFAVSGAPVTVTSVEEDTAGRGIMALKFKIRNVGGGRVTKLGEIFGINDKLAFSLDDLDWECKSAGKVDEARLVNGEAEIVCKLKNALPAGTIATKQVQLTLDYQYRSLIQETLLIKKSQ